VIDGGKSGVVASGLRDSLTITSDLVDMSPRAAAGVSSINDEFNSLKSTVSGIISGAIGPVAGVDATDLLPREDAVNENARRLADIAKNGFTGQDWMGEFAGEVPGIYETLKNAEDPKMAAAQILKDFQDGLRPELIDTERAKELVMRAIKGDESTSALIDQVAKEIAQEQGIAYEKAQSAAQDVLGGGSEEGASSPIVMDLKQNEAAVKDAGESTGKQYGEALVNTFSENVPGRLIQILAALVTPEVMAAQQAESTRTGDGGGDVGLGGGAR